MPRYGSAKALIEQKVWQDFARNNGLGLVGLSFASDGLLLKQGQGYLQVPILIVIFGIYAIAFYFFYRKRCRSLATNVFLNEHRLTYTVDHKRCDIGRQEILNITDSGIWNGLQLIIVTTHSNSEIEFFPNIAFGTHSAKPLSKKLNIWLDQARKIEKEPNKSEMATPRNPSDQIGS
ncbi:hypothetical protein [Luteolibacter sp. AS25]|uniref:hypothetical protein n=1 Tax=Luteolibacter sp. AS25 TaxID=3135776 RepID=UPI00398A8DB1